MKCHRLDFQEGVNKLGTTIDKNSTLTTTKPITEIKQDAANTIISGESRPMTTYNTKISGKDTKTESMSNRDFNNKNVYQSVNKEGDQANLKTPEIWVKKWVDFSSKYGLGYSLTDGCTGVFFNDSSKIILDINGINFNYIERGPDKQEKFNAHTLNKYPEDLEKKVKLLRYFKSYLDGDQNTQKPDVEIKPIEPNIEDTFIKLMLESENAQ
mgnify:CR=1 FL=1